MNVFPTKIIKLTTFLIAIFLMISCSKDSDLMADYILTDGAEAIGTSEFVSNDYFVTTAYKSTIFNVLANDKYRKGQRVKVIRTSTPRRGTVTINPDNTITYTPPTVLVDPPTEPVPTEPVPTEPVPTTPEPTPDPAPAPASPDPITPPTESPTITDAATDTFTYTVEIVNEDATVITEVATVEITVVDTPNDIAHTANYSTLSAISGPSTGDLVYVDEERISGIFVYNAALRTTHNGGTIINGWVRQYEDGINIKWFGAKGDGTTDDTNAINVALNLGGKIISDTGETYIVTTLYAKVDNTIVDFTGSIIKRKANTTTFMLRVNGNGVRVIGGTYEGNKSAGQSGDVYDFAAIGLANCNYSSVEGITAKDLYGIGIKLYNTNYCEIFNNTILESRIHGIYNEPATGNTEVGLKIYDNYIEVDDDDISTAIYVSSAYATNTWTKDYLIDNNHILGSLTAKQESNAVMITARGKKGTVSNNTIVGGRMGISNDYNEDGINTNNTIRDFTQYGIELVGHTNGTVRNSLVSGNNIKTTNKNGVYGIIASGASIDNIKITNNIVEGGDRNIFVQNDDAGICVGLIISGNTLINASSNIYLTNSENFSITNNTIRNNSTDNYGLFFDFSQKGIIDNNVFVGDFSGIAGFYNNDSSTVNDITISNNDITTAPITTLVGNARFGTNINIINNN